MTNRLQLAGCFTSLVLLVLVGCSSKPLPAPGNPSPADTDASWPRFHGPDGDNISPDTGLLAEWPRGGPPAIWALDGLGHGFSSVTISAARIFTDGNLGGNTTITALDLNGRVQWQTKNGPAWTASHEGTRGTPTIDGDRLYHESPLGNVICLDAASGEEIWSINILDTFDAENIKWALAESLLIDGDRLICCPFGGGAGVAALDKLTGETVWTSPPVDGGASYASPVIAEHEGRRMVLTMNATALVGVDADSGELLFEYEHRTEYDVNATMPIYSQGQIFITSGYGSGSELLELADADGKFGLESVWKSDKLDNQHGGVVLFDGHIYGSSHKNKGRWICLDWATGEVKYEEKGVGKGSLTMAEGMLYMMSEKRKVGLARATPEGLDLAGSFTIPSGGEGPTWAHPVVCGGCLYIRHGDWLYAYHVRGGQADGS